MTITLGWWAVPLVLVIVGIVGLVLDEGDRLGGVVGAAWCVLCWVAALAFTVGHFV